MMGTVADDRRAELLAEEISDQLARLAAPLSLDTFEHLLRLIAADVETELSAIADNRRAARRRLDRATGAV